MAVISLLTAPTRSTTHAHPTAEHLIRCTTELLQSLAPAGITSEIVLKRSGVSKGSLYHHFSDLSDLIETAMLRSFSEVVDENISYVRNVTENSKSEAEYYKAIVDFNEFAQASGRTAFRLNRIGLFGESISNPRLAAKLAVEQARLTQAYTEMFQWAKSRGWMSNDFDCHAAAVFIQAFTIGRVVDDISSDPMNLEAWKSLILKTITTVFGVKPFPISAPAGSALEL